MTIGSRTRIAICGVVAALGLAWAPAASAGELLSETLSAGATADRDCTNHELGSAAVDTTSVTAPALAMIEARLEGGPGDWDLAIFDADTGRTVAGSASSGSDEVAQGFADEGDHLVVQACHRSGDAGSMDLSVSSTAIEPVDEQLSLVNVSTSAPSDVNELSALGLDVTEHVGDGYAQIVARPQDFETLETEGYDYEIQVSDLAAQSDRQRAAEAQYAGDVEESALPSGRTTYRRLFDYSEEMKALAEQNPDIVNMISLPFQTYEGRTVEGIEITTNPRRDSGKPVYLQMGVHHAREWPSGEHAMEWAYEMINGYRAGDPRVVSLVENARTIVVPIVNPDGFNISREAGELSGGGGGTGGNDTVNIATSPFEYRRKNCRFYDESAPGGNCVQPSVGIAEPGVDPNRNYGGLWGGNGAGTDPLAQDYRGPGPFSEPETQNIQSLIAHNQVIALITNHTFSNLVLRPPGLQSAGALPDDALLQQLGDRMAAENGYLSTTGYGLYDTSGTTEDWSYGTAGALSYTFEIGCNRDPASGDCIGNFHPPYQEVVAQWEGTHAESTGGGNRAAYYVLAEAALDRGTHSVIEGKALGGATLRLFKAFTTATSRVLDADGIAGDKLFFDETLDTTIEVPDDGKYQWDINPSTRPIVALDKGRPATGNPSPTQTFSGGPGPSALPCADFDTSDETCWNDHAFTVPAGPGIDNGSVQVAIKWTTPSSDWDMKLFVDSNNDGSSVGETQQVGGSGRGQTTSEATSIVEPTLQPGVQYVLRVVNFAAAEPYEGRLIWAGPDSQVAQVEQWTLSCELPEGNVLGSAPVTINRGETQDLNLDTICKVSLTDAKKACKTAPDIKGSGKKDKIKGTAGTDVIAARGGNDTVKSGGGTDIICLGRGRDKANAGSGDDIVVGGGGADTEKGGKGKDSLFGNRSKDVLIGGPGQDKCDGGPGHDQTKSCKK